MAETGDGIIVPADEDTVGDYAFEQYVLSAEIAETEAVARVDDAEVRRGWRGSELIGDYARIRDGDTYSNYGYVSDMILRNGQVAAVVVQPDAAYGADTGRIRTTATIPGMAGMPVRRTTTCFAASRKSVKWKSSNTSALSRG